jgi:RHS repeat-associated protein
VQEYQYAPYGRIIDNNGADNASSKTQPLNSLTFSGKLWDRDLETYYFGARDYDPSTGTWLTQDIYRGETNSPLTLHRYLYSLNNPATLTDPYGYSVDTDLDLSAYGQISLYTSGNGERGSSEAYNNSVESIYLAGVQNDPMLKSLFGGSNLRLDTCGYLALGNGIETSCSQLELSWIESLIMFRDSLIMKYANTPQLLEDLRNKLISSPLQFLNSINTAFGEFDPGIRALYSRGIAYKLFGKILPDLYYRIKPPRSSLEFQLVGINKAFIGSKVINTVRAVGDKLKIIEWVTTPIRIWDYADAKKSYFETREKYGEDNFITESAKWEANYKGWSVIPFVGEGVAAIKSFFSPKPVGGDCTNDCPVGP